jgi:hypothetical protein
MIDEYLPQLHSRGTQIKKDLEAFYRVINELEIVAATELKQRQLELLERIKVSVILLNFLFLNNLFYVNRKILKILTLY